MNRYKQTAPRAEFVRQRHSPQSTRGERGSLPSRTTGQKEQGHSLASLFLPVKPTPKRRPSPVNSGSRNEKQYEFTFQSANTRVRAPAITLPQFNSRWISAILSAALLFALYTIWNSSTFAVSSAEISGNMRLNSEDIYQALNMNGKPIFTAIPSVLEDGLRNSFTDLEAAHVRVLFPNQIIVEVTERIPVLNWYQNDAQALIDINGVAFPPRSTAEGLIIVYANGTPPQVPVAEDGKAYNHPYLQPEMVQALVTLFPSVPAGMPVIYDPEYGVGWQDDAHDWQVYFGINAQDIQAKLVVYQAVADAAVREGRHPNVISVAYLDSPFIK